MAGRCAGSAWNSLSSWAPACLAYSSPRLASVFKRESWDRRLSQSPELGGRNSAVRILGLRCCGQYALVAERLIDLAAHPQSMKQYRQVPRHRSFLRILASAFGQPQTPALQITVGSKGTKNVVRALHHQRSQV